MSGYLVVMLIEATILIPWAWSMGVYEERQLQRERQRDYGS
jgi:hypothetical protein